MLHVYAYVEKGLAQLPVERREVAQVLEVEVDVGAWRAVLGGRLAVEQHTIGGAAQVVVMFAQVGSCVLLRAQLELDTACLQACNKFLRRKERSVLDGRLHVAFVGVFRITIATLDDLIAHVAPSRASPAVPRLQ